MQESTNITDSIELEIEKEREIQYIEDVYIAVFFDGTSNNMVQKMYFNGYFNKLKKKDDLISDENINKEHTQIKEYIEKKEELVKLKLYYQQLSANHYSNNFEYENIIKDLNNEIKEIDEKLIIINQETQINYEALDKSVKKANEDVNETSGYSNIGILYSLFNKDFPQKPINDGVKAKDHYLTHHLYVEGAGATDITNPLKSNVNGLGFGLGLTGVTALVSKAIKHVSEYIESVKSNFSNKTTLHFYIFGFSRGATCSRLFSHLLTRSKDSLLKREHEFKDFLGNKYFKNDRLLFLEDFKNRKKVEVSFLGIYDTVVSIGLLKQKDGWTDPAGKIYQLAPNYKNNWHYLNAQEYGMSINNDIKNVCHICALDEFRENFALTNVGFKVPNNAIEIFIPGCHSDVGGGYVDKDEPEIILHKETKKYNKTIKTKINFTFPHKNALENTNTELSNSDINNSNDYWGYMSLKSFEKLGWICNNENNLVDNNLRKTNKPHTIRSIEEDNILLKHIKFKRHVKRGYSDIPLAMMHKRCINKTGYNFFKEIIGEFAYSSHSLFLKRIGDQMMKLVDNQNGERIWYYPNKDYCSDDYKKLRFNFLHFTSVGRIAHFNNPDKDDETKIMEIDGANFGNKPNYDLNGLLCRITYHGDEIVEDDEYYSGVHYLYELGDSILNN